MNNTNCKQHITWESTYFYLCHKAGFLCEYTMQSWNRKEGNRYLNNWRLEHSISTELKKRERGETPASCENCDEKGQLLEKDKTKHVFQILDNISPPPPKKKSCLLEIVDSQFLKSG